MQPPRLLTGRLPSGETLCAAIDVAHNLQPKVGERRFAAYLSPYPNEEAARRALIAAGAIDVAEECRKRGRGGR